MPNFAVYQGLMSRNDWDRERQDKAMNLAALEKHSALEQAKTQREIALQEEIGGYLQLVNSLDYEPEDVERLKGLEKEERKNIIKGIGKHEGNLSSYISSGGALALKNYQNNIINSKEAQNAKETKESMTAYIKDRQDDKFVNGGIVSVPVVDKNGKKKWDDKFMTMNEQIALFKAGEIDKINYFGSEPKVEVNMMDFKKAMKDDLDPYGDNRVTQSDVMTMALSKNASQAQAEAITKKISKVWADSGEGWNWKAGDVAGYNMDAARLNQNAERINNEQRRWEYEQTQSGSANVEEYYLNEIEGNLKELQRDNQGNVVGSYDSPEFKFDDGHIGGVVYTTPLTSQGQKITEENGFGITDGSAESSFVNMFEKDDGETGEDIDIDRFNQYKTRTNSTLYISPRTGKTIELQSTNYGVTSMDNKMTHLVSPTNQKTDVMEQKVMMPLSDYEKLNEQYKLNDDFDGGNMKEYSVAGWNGSMVELTLFQKPATDRRTFMQANKQYYDSQPKEGAASTTANQVEANKFMQYNIIRSKTNK